jgi:hypothetical protein
MCSLCRCELPMHRDGHVTKATIKAHNLGQKHQAAKSRRDEEDAATFASECVAFREYIAREALARIDRLQYKRHILLLAVVATRLRAEYCSMDAARTLWTIESDAALNQLESSALKAALKHPAAAHVSKHHILKAASDAWLVVNLVINVAGI